MNHQVAHLTRILDTRGCLKQHALQHTKREVDARVIGTKHDGRFPPVRLHNANYIEAIQNQVRRMTSSPHTFANTAERQTFSRWFT
jgi:hypothetical protein